MIPTPLVSIVIPTYNRAHDLVVALESVVCQTYPHWEALVVDNHSVDNTAAVVQQFNDPRIKYLTVHNNGVIAVSRNLGIQYASGEFVAFLDSDDFWRENKLAVSVDWLNQGFDVLYHDMNLVYQDRSYLRQKRFVTRQVGSPVYADLLMHGNVIATSGVLVRTSLLRMVGGFSEDADLIAGEDYELWLRLGGVTERFKRLDTALGSLGRGSDNQFSSRRLITILSYVEEHHLSRLPPELQRLAHVNWLDYAYARSRYTQRDYAGAKRGLRRVLLSSPNWVFRLKAAWMLGVIAMRPSAGLPQSR